MRTLIPGFHRPLLRTVSLLVVGALILGARAVHADVEPPGLIELQIATIGARAGGWAFAGRVAVTLPDVPPNRDVTRVVVQLTARDGTATITPSVVTFDAPALATPLGADLTVAVPRGEVEIVAHAEAYDAAGAERWGRTDSVFVLAGTGTPRVGRSSVVDLVRDELGEQYARGVITAADLETAMRALVAGTPREPGTARFVRPAAPRAARGGTVATTTVHGNCKYVVRNGTAGAGPYRPIANAFLQFVDRQAGGDVLVGPFTATDASGNYQATVPGMRNDGSPVNLVVQVFAFRLVNGTLVAAVGPANQRSSTWGWQSGAAEVATATTTVDIIAGPSGLTSNRAFSIFDVLNVGYEYLRSQHALGVGNDPLALPLDFVEFPGQSANGSFFSDDFDAHLNIGQNHAFDWDVLFHELGHYVQFLNGTSVGVGGQHFITGNNTGNNCNGFSGGVCQFPRPAPLTKDQGTRLAWGEGWPTFFGTNLQLAVNAASFDVPTAGDTRYDDTANGFGYDLDTNTDLGRGTGEDNELAVQRALWDLADGVNDESDVLSLGTELLIDVSFDPAAPITLSQFWNLLLPRLPIEHQFFAGATLGDHGVSPLATAPSDFLPVDDTTPPPTFTWDTQGAGGSPNPITAYGPSYRLNRFNVKFYDDGFATLVFTSPAIVTNGTTDRTASYTPSLADWAVIQAARTVQWMVEGSSDAPGPTTGIYRSGARTLDGNEPPTPTPLSTRTPTPTATRTATPTPTVTPEHGFLPPDKQALACTNKTATLVGKLLTGLAKCHVKAATAAFKTKPFDLTACETQAAGDYDAKGRAIANCPACVPANAAAVRNAVHAFLDARNGDVYCTGTTALGAITGFVPPDKDALGCAAKLTTLGTTLGNGVVKCHTKAASTVFKGRPFDRRTCESTAEAKYDGSIGKVKKCPACAVTGAGVLRDAITSFVTARSGDVYCAGSLPFPE